MKGPKGSLRIGIDAHVVGRPRGGNERVMGNLIPALRSACDHQLFLYFGSDAVANDWRARSMPATTVRSISVSNPLLRLGMSLRRASRKDRLDAMLCHYNRPAFAACPVVTIVHDVSFARYPSYFSRYERTYMNLTIPASMRRSAGVVTDSQFSSAEITDLYSIPPERITVAPHGVDPKFLADGSGPPAVDGPYFLSVGSLQPRKNLVTLIRAYRRLLDLHPEVSERLVITGRELRVEGTYEEADELRRADRIRFTGHVDDDQLAALYRNATAFAYPSVYEGFGLPPVEAMASETPVVVADIPVMAEVAGEAALRVPALDADAWADALWRLASQRELRQQLALAGRERAERYTWAGSASRVLDALERAC